MRDTGRVTELEKLQADAWAVFAQMGRDVEEMLDGLVPGRRELRESIARLGYQGARCGWYPERPKRRRKSAR
jgi:hypothetical protein